MPNPLQVLRRAAFLRLMRLSPSTMRRLVGKKRLQASPGLDLQTAFLLRLSALENRQSHERSVRAQRAEIDLMSPASGGPPRSVLVEDRTVPVQGAEIPVRIYRPRDGQSDGSKLPVLVFFHGGGWVIGSIESHDRPCRILAEDTPCIVVSVGYRLAPEHKFPTALDDAFSAFLWVADHIAAFGGDPSRIAVGGDSAGGNLTIGVTRLAKSAPRGGPVPTFQLVIYPVTNLTRDPPSALRLREGYYLTLAQMHWFREQYLRNEAERADPRASPLLANDLANMPPSHVVVAGYDPIFDDGREYAQKLERVGSPVKLVEYPDLIHGFLCMTEVLARAATALSEMTEALRAGFSHGTTHPPLPENSLATPRPYMPPQPGRRPKLKSLT